MVSGEAELPLEAVGAHKQRASLLLARQRGRATGVLLVGVVAATTGYIGAFTASTLLAEEITGSATWSGVVAAASVLGAAGGASLLAAAMRRWGRRRGLAASYAIAAVGALTAVWAARADSFGLLVAGLLVVGLGQSASALTRYVAADLHPIERRASALGWVVWTGTLGAIVGPNLLGPTGSLVEGWGWPPLAGAYVAAAALYAFAAAVYAGLLHPDPATLVVGDGDAGSPAASAQGLPALLRLYPVRVALATLVTGQAVMVLIMTMTPLHVHGAGYSLQAVGVVMSGHVVGMFLFSPVIGRLVDRFGALAVILAGQATLILAAGLAAAAHTSQRAWVVIALFLLGLGWNLGYVAGSSLLTSGLGTAERSRLQGFADSMVWGSAALASLGSSLVLASAGYRGLCLVGASLVVVPLAVVAARGRR